MKRRQKETAAQRKREEENERREQTDLHRRMCYVNLFWMKCPKRGCRRARKCIGDPHACFDRRWDAMSESERVFRREFMDALWLRRESLQEAIAAASAARAAYDQRRHRLGSPSWRNDGVGQSVPEHTLNSNRAESA